MQFREKAHLMTASEIERTLVHLAHEIVEKTAHPNELAFVGIRRRGFYLAERLARKIGQMSSVAVPVGGLDIQQYRDDLGLRPGKTPVLANQIPFSNATKDVALGDDVS